MYYKDVYRVSKINKPKVLKIPLRLLQALLLVPSIYIYINKS